MFVWLGVVCFIYLVIVIIFFFAFIQYLFMTIF
jgi:hypothetical protein